MEINGKLIQGIFKYSPDITYSKGDFVVSGLKLYTVIVNKVTGEEPCVGSPYYSIYLSDDVINFDSAVTDLKDYMEGKGSDKTVSALSVGKILSSYISGFNERGIIGSEINEAGEAYLRDYFDDSTYLGIINPLDIIMMKADLNNAVFKVSGTVAKSIVGSDQDYALLRQYTYKNSSGVGVRVQELVDPINAIIRFRYATEANGYEPTNSWTSGNVGSDIVETVDNVLNYYTEKATSYDRNLYALRSAYRYKSVDFAYTSTISVAEGNNELRVPINKFQGLGTNSNSYLVTICIVKAISTGLYNTASLTIDINTGNSVSYKTIGDLEVQVYIGNDDYVHFTTTNGSYIKDIYYKMSLDDEFPGLGSDYVKTKEVIVNKYGEDSNGAIVYSVNLEDNDLTDKTGYFLIYSSEYYNRKVGTTVFKTTTAAVPLLFGITRGSSSVTSVLTSRSGRNALSNSPVLVGIHYPNVSWEVKTDGVNLLMYQNIYDTNGNQIVGASSDDDPNKEIVTKVVFIEYD